MISISVSYVASEFPPTAKDESAHANNKSSAELTVQGNAVHQRPHRTALVLPDRSGDPGNPVRGVDLVLVESLFA
jgi:hypothetical protein